MRNAFIHKPKPLALSLCALALSFAPQSQAQNLGNPSCDNLLLVSSWRNNEVKIYDGCSGAYIRDLDQGGRLAGPQAMAIGPDGDVYVISERNNRIVRYHRDDLSYDQVIVGDQPETPAVEASPLESPTGATFIGGDQLLVVNFNSRQAVVVDVSGNSPPTSFTTSGVSGADAGLAVDHQQRVYIPGFNGSTVARAQADGSDAELLISAGSGGLDAPRSILITDRQVLLVSSWRSDEILRYDAADGTPRGPFNRDVVRPTALALRNPDEILVASDSTDDVRRIDARSGQSLGTLIPTGSGGLDGATFILPLRKRQPAQQGQQLWLGALATIDDKTIQADNVSFTAGTFFGTDFQPDAAERIAWGTITITFDSCDTATMRYQANDAFFLEFGSGGYPLFRLARSPAGRACTEQGFDQITENGWMTGAWYGRDSRDGEGFSIDVLENNRAIVTWYTYRSRQP